MWPLKTNKVEGKKNSILPLLFKITCLQVILNFCTWQLLKFGGKIRTTVAPKWFPHHQIYGVHFHCIYVDTPVNISDRWRPLLSLQEHLVRSDQIESEKRTWAVRRLFPLNMHYRVMPPASGHSCQCRWCVTLHNLAGAIRQEDAPSGSDYTTESVFEADSTNQSLDWGLRPSTRNMNYKDSEKWQLIKYFTLDLQHNHE